MKFQNYTILIILILNLNTSNTSPENHDENQITLPTISTFTQAVHQRFYFSTRLENPINMLQEIKEKSDKFTAFSFKEKDIIPLEGLNSYSFKHPRILKCIKLLKREKALSSFFQLWQEVSGYKFLGDQLFINEFITLLMFFTQKIVLVHVEISTKQTELINEALKKALNSKRPIKLDFIAACVEQYYLQQTNKPFDEKILQELLNQENKNNAHKQRITKNSDSIFERFYHIKRLTKPIEKLLALEEKNIFCQGNTAFDNTLNFQDARIQSIIQQIETSKSSEPIHRAWRDFRRFKSVEDNQYLKDILKMLFVAYKNILTKKMPLSSKIKAEESLKTIEYLYNEIEQMNSDGLLNAIDMLTIELESILASENKSYFSRLKNITESRRFWGTISFITAGALIYLPKIFFHLNYLSAEQIT